MAVVESAYYITPAAGSNGFWVMWAAIIKNPNKRLIGESPVLTIIARDADGTVVGTEDQTLDALPPGGTIAFASQVTANKKPVRVEIISKSVDFRPTETTASAYKPFAVKDTRLTRSSVGNYEVTGEVTNPYSQAVSSIAVVALLRDVTGKLVGGEVEFKDDIPANGSLAFQFDVGEPTVKPTKAEYIVTPWVADVSWEELAAKG